MIVCSLDSSRCPSNHYPVSVSPSLSVSLSPSLSLPHLLCVSFSLCLSVSRSLNPSSSVPAPLNLSLSTLSRIVSFCLSLDLSVCLSFSWTFCLRQPKAQSYPHAHPSGLVPDARVARAISAVSRWLRGSSRLGVCLRQGRLAQRCLMILRLVRHRGLRTGLLLVAHVHAYRRLLAT